MELNFQVFDCCGTGGDSSETFNISTTAAIIAAANKIKIAKNGDGGIHHPDAGQVFFILENLLGALAVKKHPVLADDPLLVLMEHHPYLSQ